MNNKKNALVAPVTQEIVLGTLSWVKTIHIL